MYTYPSTNVQKKEHFDFENMCIIIDANLNIITGFLYDKSGPWEASIGNTHPQNQFTYIVEGNK